MSSSDIYSYEEELEDWVKLQACEAMIELHEFPPQAKLKLKPRVGVTAIDTETQISASVDCSRRQYQNKEMAVALVKAMNSYWREKHSDDR